MNVLGINVDGIHCYLCAFAPELTRDEDPSFSFDVKSMWIDSESLNQVCREANITMIYQMVSGKPMIAISQENIDADVTAIYDFIKALNYQIDEQRIAQIKEQFRGVGMNCDDDDVHELLRIFKRFQNIAESEGADYCQEISSELPASDEVIAIIDRLTNGYPKPANNETLFMTNPEAEVFIKIPSLARMQMFNETGNYVLPYKYEIAEPYSNPDYYTYEYKEAIRGRYDQELLIEGNIDNNVNTNEEGTDPLIRKDENGIYPNEKRYYNELVKLVRYAMTNGGKDPDITRAYAPDDIMSARYAGDSEVKDMSDIELWIREYLVRLCERIGTLNWMHTGLIPISRDYNENDEDEENEKEEIESSLSFNNEHTMGIDPRTTFKSVYQAMRDLKSPEGMAEFIVKMLRWGSRKPTKVLWSSPKIKLEFDLATFSLGKEAFSMLNAQPTLFEGGYQYLLTDLIITNKAVVATELPKRLEAGAIIGVTLERPFIYTNSMGEQEEERQTIYMSLLDVLEILDSKPNDIYGLKYDGNDFIIDDVVRDNFKFITMQSAINMANSCKDLTHILYQSTKIDRLLITLGIPKTDINYLTVLYMRLFYKNFSSALQEKFDSLEDAKDKIHSNGNIAIGDHIFAEILDAFLEPLKIDGSRMEHLSLDVMLKIMLDTLGGKVKNSLFEANGTIGTVKARQALADRMNIKMEDEGEITMAQAKEMLKNTVVNNIEADEYRVIARVLDNGERVRTPFYLAIKYGVNANGKTVPTLPYVILHEQEVPKPVQSQKTLSIHGVLKTLGEQSLKMFNGNWEDNKIVFGSESSLKAFNKFINHA